MKSLVGDISRVWIITRFVRALWRDPSGAQTKRTKKEKKKEKKSKRMLTTYETWKGARKNHRVSLLHRCKKTKHSFLNQ
jgi:hypothetical protein